jgi:hypothetical protein
LSVRRVVSVLVSAALAIVGSAVVSSPANAAVGYSHNVPFTWTDANNGISVLPVTFTAGDCRLEGTNQTDNPLSSSIQLVADAQPGQYDIIWNATAYTIDRNDVWRGDWYFEDDTSVLFQIHFDLALSNHSQVYRVSLLYRNIVLPTAHSFTNVTWRGDC